MYTNFDKNCFLPASNSGLQETTTGHRTSSAPLNQSSSHYILHPQRLIRPILRFEQHGAALQRLQAMPLPGRNIQHRPARDHVDRLRQRAAVIIEVLFEMPAYADTRLRRETMTMDWHHRPGLNRVQHPLGLVLRRIPQIQVAPQAGIVFRLLCQTV